MSVTTLHIGRLGNQIIRNLAVSLIAEKHNLYVDYSSHSLISELGINLFCGQNKYKNTMELTDDNYFSVLQNPLNVNLNPNPAYFQTKEITNYLHTYIYGKKHEIINKNKFASRYNANNDIFIHIRLTDAAQYNPGIDYYLNAILRINANNIYIATDDARHTIITQIINVYPNANLICCNEINTIQFGSTCKHIILSNGSFSAVIGYLSFFSDIYYPEYNKMWHGDIFSIPGWNLLK